MFGELGGFGNSNGDIAWGQKTRTEFRAANNANKKILAGRKEQKKIIILPHYFTLSVRHWMDQLQATNFNIAKN